MTSQEILICVLAAVAAVALVYCIYRRWGDRFDRLLALKRRIDKWQQEIVKFAIVLSEWKLPFSADIAGKVSALAIGEAIKATRDLRKLLQAPGGMLKALTENFYYQIPLRCEDDGEVKRLAAAVAKEPKLMAAIDEIKAGQ